MAHMHKFDRVQLQTQYTQIEALKDVKTVTRRRGARARNITVINNAMEGWKETPIEALVMKEIEKKLFDLRNNIELYQALQNKYEDLIDDEELEREQEKAETTMAAFTEVVEQCETTMHKVEMFSLGKTLMETVDDINSMAKLDSPRVRERISQLSSDISAYRCDTSVMTNEKAISDLRDRLRTNLGVLEERLSKEQTDKEAVVNVEAKSSVAESSARIVKNKLTIELPKFEGGILEWPGFWKLFSGLVEKETGLNDQDKRSLLVRALNGVEAKKEMDRVLQFTETYDEAVRALKERYEQPKVVFTHHLTTYFKPEILGGSLKDVQTMRDQVRTVNLGLKAGNGDSLSQVLVGYMATKMDTHIKKRWKDFTRKSDDPPDCKVLEEFLRGEELRALEERSTKPSKPANLKSSSSSQVPPRKTALRTQGSSKKVQCPICCKNHSVFFCTDFKILSTTDRFEKVKSLRLCFNCLGEDHSATQCTSSKRCQKCSKHHHTLLHSDDGPGIQRNTSTSKEHSVVALSEESVATAVVNRVSHKCLPLTFLALASSGGNKICCRGQQDTGATLSLVTKKLAQSMRAKKIPHSSIQIHGVGGELFSPYQVDLKLCSTQSSQSIQIRASVVDTIPPYTSSASMKDVRCMPNFQTLTLADPEYMSGDSVDVLLSATHTNWTMLDGAISSTDKSYRAQNTIFGWIIGGDGGVKPPTATCLRISAYQETPEKLMKSIWELDQSPYQEQYNSLDDLQAKENFVDTHSRDSSGRYVVRLPRKTPAVDLGESRSLALKRFNANERTLKKKNQLEAYQAVVQEYLELDHAEVIPPNQVQTQPGKSYYFPMFGVVKADSTTTKLRAVCDASAKTTSGFSLNETLLSGPSLYPSLTSIINRFRQHKIGMAGDISKMFREIALNPDEYDYHRFFHRGNEGQLLECRMTRLTFGVTSSPYLASQVLHQLAEDEGDTYPDAARLIKSAFYVDDVLTGAESGEEAIKVREELNQLLGKACMTLRKWRTNSPELRTTIPNELQDKKVLPLQPEGKDFGKMLGVHWDTQDDNFYVAIPDLTGEGKVTKRILASGLAKVYDLLGWFSPAILNMKILLQECWKNEIKWDEELPIHMKDRWKVWANEVSLLSEHPIPRRYASNESPPLSVTIHGFCDASAKAYGGVIYMRTMHQDSTISVSMIMAKTKLAPLHSTTIPRLELCGALVLAKLLSAVIKDLDVSPTQIYAWTDSAVVLGWLRKAHSRLKVFVANRVAQVQELIPTIAWRYVDTKSNPADILSRGIQPKELLSHSLWWEGPSWLKASPNSWPIRRDIDGNIDLPELKQTVLVIQQPIEEYGRHSSSWSRLCRATARIIRLFRSYQLYKLFSSPQYTKHLTLEELRHAKTQLIRLSQQFMYQKEINVLKQGKSLPINNALCTLNAYLDNVDVLRVGGRLHNSDLPVEEAHPIIMSSKSHLSRLYLENIHRINVHAGPSVMMSLVGRIMYMSGLRKILKSISRQCVICRKAYARTRDQQMGCLPEDRVTRARPFSVVGVDLAGPLKYKEGRIRKPLEMTGYVCVYICLITRSVFFDLVEDLSTSAFISSLRRFAAIYGSPDQIMSDNGSNFVGAAGEIQRVIKFLKDSSVQSAINQWALTRDVKWKFIPGRAPNFGGLWEAAVRSMKTTLRKVIGHHVVRREELQTLLLEAAAMLNTRPLTATYSQDSESLEPLTPFHFLTGGMQKVLPLDDDPNSRMTYGKKWALMQRLTQDLWQRWQVEYLQNMQKRSKWKKSQPNAQVGDIVLLKDLGMGVKRWPLGRIVKTYVGKDGLVRAADVYVNSKIYNRPIRNLVPLIEEDSRSICPGENVQASA